jgi:cell division protein FtsW
MSTTTFSRTNISVIGRWWLGVDRWTIAALVVLAAAGVVLAMAASPAVAEHLGKDIFYFAKRQLFFLAPAVVAMLGISMLGESDLRKFAIALYCFAFVMLVMVLVHGTEIKGATRWISFAGITIQPSEFMKPAFIVLSAWMFTAWRLNRDFACLAMAFGIYGISILMLLAQPDVGMALLISMVWGVQFFLAGLPMMLVVGIGLLFVAGGVGAYYEFDHVRQRIDKFLDPAGSEAYQVARSLEAFRNGGIYGVGPGEGQVKAVLPDAHADFVFAVAGEEFGLFPTLLIVMLFCFIVLRGFARVFKSSNLFAQLAVAGLLAQFGLQAIINMASTLNLMPTKGMTLPFISYGGSSMLALACGMGMVLALTRTGIVPRQVRGSGVGSMLGGRL